MRAGPEPTILHTGDQPLGNVLAWYLHDEEDLQEGQDIRYLTHSRRAPLEQPINWVDPPPRDEPVVPLEMDRCWREGCYGAVPRDDDLGLCPRCVEHLRTL